MLAFVDEVHSKNWGRNTSPMKNISLYEVTNMPTIIGEFSINYEMTTPKSCHYLPTNGNLVVSIISDFLQIANNIY